MRFNEQLYIIFIKEMMQLTIVATGCSVAGVNKPCQFGNYFSPRQFSLGQYFWYLEIKLKVLIVYKASLDLFDSVLTIKFIILSFSKASSIEPKNTIALFRKPWATVWAILKKTFGPFFAQRVTLPLILGRGRYLEK